MEPYIGQIVHYAELLKGRHQAAMVVDIPTLQDPRLPKTIVNLTVFDFAGHITGVALVKHGTTPGTWCEIGSAPSGEK